MEWNPRLRPKNTSIIVKMVIAKPPNINRLFDPIGIKNIVKPRKEAVRYGMIK